MAQPKDPQLWQEMLREAEQALFSIEETTTVCFVTKNSNISY